MAYGVVKDKESSIDIFSFCGLAEALHEAILNLIHPSCTFHRTEIFIDAITDPMCPESREKRRVQNQLFYILGNTGGPQGISNPNMPQRVSIPIYIRFIGLIILMGGYGVIYLLGYLGIITNTILFDVLVFGVFMASLVLGGVIQKVYVRRSRLR